MRKRPGYEKFVILGSNRLGFSNEFFCGFTAVVWDSTGTKRPEGMPGHWSKFGYFLKMVFCGFARGWGPRTVSRATEALDRRGWYDGEVNRCFLWVVCQPLRRWERKQVGYNPDFSQSPKFWRCSFLALACRKNPKIFMQRIWAYYIVRTPFTP